LTITVSFTIILIYISSTSSSSSASASATIAQHGRQVKEKLKDLSWVGLSRGRWGYREPTTTVSKNDPFVEGPITVKEEEDSPIKINMRPLSVADGASPYEEEENEKYIGYLPHSGFHNQRAALQNALYLGKLLNRTVYVFTLSSLLTIAKNEKLKFIVL